MTPIPVGRLHLGGPKGFFLIAGPCVIEPGDMCRRVAEQLRKITDRLKLPFIFKSSYDKANRSTADSFRGPGLEMGLRVLAAIKKDLDVPILTDVHCPEEVEQAAAVADILQIPAFLCRQTDLVVKCANSGRAVNIKKGQFVAPWDMKGLAEKASRTGNRKILLTERGYSFGYNNLVFDPRSIPAMQGLGYPVVFDATHSAQLPMAQNGRQSGGMREMVPTLAKAAVAAGCDGLFMEIHENPAKAKSDAATQWPLKKTAELLEQLLAIREAVS